MCVSRIFYFHIISTNSVSISVLQVEVTVEVIVYADLSSTSFI